MTQLVYDAGALIAAERDDPRLWAIHLRALMRGIEPSVPAAVLAQVWRSHEQRGLRRLIDGCDVVPLTQDLATRVGELLAVANRADVVDAQVVACCFESAATCVTSDRGDIAHLAEAARNGAWRGNTRWKLPIISL
ncbi:PIN domain-containing protein [Kribbella sp. NPDC023972]|uniref:PIN domain-containing protein n=1 Tax=Kribbella sp. NPDC023972 TaxID=3154795 RepID=UPI0033FA974A